MTNETKPTSIRLPAELLQKIAQDAEKDKRSITMQIEYMVQQYYEMKKILNR